MKIYNTLSRKKEELKPQPGGEVKLYSCGPTVYDYFHIGNARPFVVFDTLRRYLEYRGEKVNFVQNFTDIDDKIIRKANEEGVSTAEVSERYIKEYFKDAEALRIRPATTHPKATENVPEIIDMVKTLIEKGYAYEVGGDVYFSARKFPAYGKLSKKNVDDLESGARVEVDERKKDPLDFALWKKAKEGEPSWDSPWGKGRPGWHIECSVMSRKYLGDTIDIHGGGQDLIFPHHENEIAQSEAATGKTFSRNFMHNGYINIDNKKMSKSLGNFKTVRDILKKFDGETLRFFILSAHYRSPISFNDKILEQAKNGLARLRDFKADLEAYKPIGAGATLGRPPEEFGDDVARAKHAPQREANVGATFGRPPAGGRSDETETAAAAVSKFRADFIAAMDDDLNTAKALGVLFNFVTDTNKRMAEKTLTSGGKEDAKNFLAEAGSILGLLEDGDDIPAEVKEILAERKEARAEKDFAKSDELRDRLAELGFIVKDGRDGQSLVRK